MNLKDSIRRRALEIGFDLVGVAPPGPFPEHAHYLDWLARGYHGEMAYMERNREKRRDVRAVLPSARSVIVCALNYNTAPPYSTEFPRDPSRGWISRYAWGDDYHDVLGPMLRDLVEAMRGWAGTEIETRIYVDTGPVPDRVLAYHAGLGWFAKNTMILHPKLGSWFFIGSILTSLDLEPDLPMADRCGTCRLCLDACPTGALPEPRVLDANLCISYLTIETKGPIPEAMRGSLGGHVFGCDFCQDVCPWNRKAPETAHPSFQPRPDGLAPDLSRLLDLGPDAFNRRFRGSPLKRPKWRGILRNVLLALAAANRDLTGRTARRVEALARSDEGVVAETARWVLARARRP